MVPSDVDLTGETIDGRYLVDCRLGSGGMGTVWRAQHRNTLQYFALKTLRVHPETASGSVRRCLKEARAAAALRSRHVVRVIDVQPDHLHLGRPLPFLVMELLEGSDFQSQLEHRKNLTRGEVSWVLTQVCRGIQAAHDSGIVHRDLKPANIFLAVDDDGSCVVKICDFGLAKLATEVLGADSTSTDTGVLVGTPRYMAPEQLRTETIASAATDQWAIGLIAYRLLAGRDYFDGARNGVELSLRIVHDDLPAPSRSSALVPREFDEWFFTSCARDPSRRFPSAMAQGEALARLLGGSNPITLSTSRHCAARSGELNGLADPIGATMPSEPGCSPNKSQAFRVALGISAVFGLIGTAAVAARLPFPSQRAPRVSASMPVPTARRVVRIGEEGWSVIEPTAPTTNLEPAAAAAIAAPELVPAVHKPPRISRHSNLLSREVAATSPIQTQADPPSILPTEGKALGADAGAPCTRSSQCASHLCVAEQCR